MFRYVLSPRALRTGKVFGLFLMPLKVETKFDYLETLKAACYRDDLEGEREARENPAELVSEPGDDEDFDIPSPFPSPSLCPSSRSSASVDTSHSVDGHGVGSCALDDEHDDNPADHSFTGITITATPSAESSFASTASPSSALQPSPVTLASGSATPTLRGKRRSERAKAANKERSRAKKRQKTEARRKQGLPSVHGEAFIKRHAYPDVISQDFEVLHLEAVKGGDTGRNRRSKKGGAGPRTLEEAGEANFTLFPWNGEYVPFCFPPLHLSPRHSYRLTNPYTCCDCSRTAYLVDSANKLSITCAGKIVEDSPRALPTTWEEGMKRLADFLDSVRRRYESTFTKKHQKHRRGPYTTVPIGVTRGSGSKVSSSCTTHLRILIHDIFCRHRTT